jgi:hypothetical protein
VARLDADTHLQAKAHWEELRRALRFVEVTAQLEREAGDLAVQHALSGFDAIHLASALTIAAVPVVVATWDGRMHEAAQAKSLATLPGHLTKVRSAGKT